MLLNDPIVIGVSNDEKNALQGTQGTPSNTNRYVTFEDARAGASIHGSLYSGVPVGTTSTTFVDAFAGSSVAIPEDGDYLVMFEGAVEGTSNSNSTEVAIGLNSTTTAVADTPRAFDTGNNRATIVSTTILTGLVNTDVINGLFRREGGTGTSTMNDRRLTVVKVTT